MKINREKIIKYQEGGYLQYRPLTRPPEAMPQGDPEPTARQTKAAAAEGGLDEKSMQKLLGNGITNDVMAFSNQMQQVESQYATLSDSEKEGPKGRHLRSLLKGNFGELNALIRSKDTFDKAVAKSQAAGGLEEFAVVPGAFVVKRADGSLDKVGFQQYAKDRNEGTIDYKPLTNSELAREREYNKNLTGNNSVFSILEYSKGINEVQKEVLGIANGIGKSSQSNTTGAYDEATVEAMRDAKLKAGQGVFKVKESSSMSTNAPQIQRAKQVMWATLSDNSKNVLRARAAFTEKDPSKVEERAATLAMDLLDPRLEQSQTTVSDMMATKAGKGAGAGQADQLTNLGERESAVNGKTQVEHLSLLSDYGVGIDSRMYVLPKDDITKVNKDGVVVPTSLAGSDIAKYGYIGQATTLNGDKVNPNTSMFTGEAYYTRIPVKQTSNGLVLDEEGAKKLAAAEDEYRNLPASQHNAMMEQVIRQKHGAGNLKIQEVILAEAASYEDKYTFWGLRGKRDSKYYKDADEQTEKLLGEVVDPNSEGPRHGIDYKAYKHLVIIPSKGGNAARFADKNNLLAPKSGFDVTNPLRGPQSSERTFGGSAFSSGANRFSQNSLDN